MQLIHTHFNVNVIVLDVHGCLFVSLFFTHNALSRPALFCIALKCETVLTNQILSFFLHIAQLCESEVIHHVAN